MNNSKFSADGYGTESPPYMSSSYFVDPFTVKPVKQVLIAVYVTIFIVGFSGNLMVMFVIAKNRRMRTVTNFFLGNLAFSDCLAMTCNDIPILIYFVSEVWPFGNIVCAGAFFVVSVTSSASILILVVISVERYMAILHPFELRQLVTTKLLSITVGVIWVVAVLLGIPVLFSYQVITYGEYRLCVVKESVKGPFYAAQSYAKIVFLYLAPLLIMCVLYGAIGRTLWATSPDVKFSQCNAVKNEKIKSKTSVGYRSVTSEITLTNSLEEKNESNNHAVRLESQVKVGPFFLEEPVNDDIGPSGESDFMQDGNDNVHIVCPKPIPMTPVEKLPSLGSGGRSGKNWSIFRPFRESRYVSGTCQKSGAASSRSTKRRRKTEAVRAARRKAVRMLGVIVVCFALCLFPMQLMALLNTLSLTFGIKFPVLQQTWFYPFVYACYFFNSALNPFLYAFLSNNFRKSFLETITCQSNRRRRGTTRCIQRLKSVTSDANTEVVYMA